MLLQIQKLEIFNFESFLKNVLISGRKHKQKCLRNLPLEIFAGENAWNLKVSESYLPLIISMSYGRLVTLRHLQYLIWHILFFERIKSVLRKLKWKEPENFIKPMHSIPSRHLLVLTKQTSTFHFASVSVVISSSVALLQLPPASNWSRGGGGCVFTANQCW